MVRTDNEGKTRTDPTLWLSRRRTLALVGTVGLSVGGVGVARASHMGADHYGRIVIEEDIEPNQQVLVTATIDGHAFADAEVRVNNVAAATTNADGQAWVEVPADTLEKDHFALDIEGDYPTADFESALLTLALDDEALERARNDPDDHVVSEFSVFGNPFDTGSDVDLHAMAAEAPIANAPVLLDGDVVAHTDADGWATVTVERAERFRVRVNGEAKFRYRLRKD